jgi:antitoxin (DNA-binding transcriptional repressor) of toxin-antitoxin stability system
MKTISVGELESKFAQILEWIQKGEGVIVSYGRKKEEVAVLVDIKKFKRPAVDEKPKIRKLGTLEGKATFIFHDDWEMSDEELINS